MIVKTQQNPSVKDINDSKDKERKCQLLPNVSHEKVLVCAHLWGRSIARMPINNKTVTQGVLES